jgi:hypothetical protein
MRIETPIGHYVKYPLLLPDFNRLGICKILAKLRDIGIVKIRSVVLEVLYDGEETAELIDAIRAIFRCDLSERIVFEHSFLLGKHTRIC